MSLIAGVDLGGTNMRVILADDAGAVLEERRIPTESHAGPQSVLTRLSVLIADMAKEAGGLTQAVGVGLPGLVDIRAGTARFLPNLPGNWRDVSVAQILSASLNCPVYLLNDARLAALGELEFGIGRDVNDMVFITLGTGIGGAVVLDGKLRLGAMGAAGEIGHQTIIADGPLCGCGNRGCLETLASSPALIAEGVRLLKSGQAPHLYDMVSGDAGRVTPIEMKAAADAGDEGVRAAIARVGALLGIGIANVVSVLYPELVAIGGGLSLLGEMLLGPVRREVRERVRMFPTDDLRIEASVLGNRVGALGGVALARRGGI